MSKPPILPSDFEPNDSILVQLLSWAKNGADLRQRPSLDQLAVLNIHLFYLRDKGFISAESTSIHVRDHLSHARFVKIEITERGRIQLAAWIRGRAGDSIEVEAFEL